MAGQPTAARLPYADIAPALAEYTDRVLFKDVWERPGLSLGAASLLLLFIGIHVAWDNVAYHVLGNRRGIED